MKQTKKVLKIYQLPEWYVDFDKVQEYAKKYQNQLLQLQTIIHLPNLKVNLFNLIQKDFVVLKLLFLMIAQRWKDFKMKKEWGLDKKSSLAVIQWEKIFLFLQKAGLITILTNKTINHPFDYYFGVEVGLDSNARKNRTGKLMEKKVEETLNGKKVAGKIAWYEKEQKISSLIDKHNLAAIDEVNLPEIVKKKKFDFIYQKDNNIYLLECNCYNVGGSKIDTTIVNYQKLNEELQLTSPHLKFVWVSDGIYWQDNPKVWDNTAKKIKNFLCLHDFEQF